MLKVSKIEPLPNWSRKFEPAIPIVNRRALFTLCDTGQYIAALPKAEHDAPAWRTAIELLMFAAEKGAEAQARQKFSDHPLNRETPALANRGFSRTLAAKGVSQFAVAR